MKYELEDKAKEILKQFQCEKIRYAEEVFAQTLSESDKVRLFFINENQAFTDGKNIVVDPAEDALFVDKPALKEITKFLKWPNVVLKDPWNVLRIVTRAQSIHECLHILYTKFPGKHVSDPICDTKNKKITMGLISNIIEDAYIEAVGCSQFDNMDWYLRFGRVSQLFASQHSEGTVRRAFEAANITEAKAENKDEEKENDKKREGTVQQVDPEKKKASELMDYLDYMATFLLYPMVKQSEPDDTIKDYVESTRQYYLDGSVAPSPDERYDYCTKVFDEIKDLIPADSVEIDTEALDGSIRGMKTHNAETGSVGGEEREGRTQVVTKRLFDDDNVPVDYMMNVISGFAKDKDEVASDAAFGGMHVNYSGSNYDCAAIHKDIRINENHPRINRNFRMAYQNIYKLYSSSIRSYSNRFSQLLKARAEEPDDRYLFGRSISSKRFGDVKKRYWVRGIEGIGAPDMSIMLLIDGSGSMAGSRRKHAMHSAVILHEVLKNVGITHAIVEHRAAFDAPEVDANILFDFNGKDDEKLNIMQLDADDNTREGLALFWGERYINRQTDNERKIIIVISDGAPMHSYDDYYPPISNRDTANAVKKITTRGTDIIAIALDENDGCYEALKDIYPNILACHDLNRLTGQVLGVISKLM